MASVIQFFSPDVAVDRDKLTHTIATISAIQITRIDEQWIEKAGVQSPRRVEDFRFYDLDLFRRIETVAQKSRRTAATASSVRVSGVAIDWIFPAAHPIQGYSHTCAGSTVRLDRERSYVSAPQIATARCRKVTRLRI